MCGDRGIGTTAFVETLVPRPTARLLLTPAMTSQPLFAVRTLLGEALDTTDAVAAVGQLRQRLATPGRPSLVVLDGLDHLDDASASVLAQVVASGGTRLVGVRHRVPPARDAIAVLWRDLGLVRLDLAPLDRPTMATLLAAALGGAVEGRSEAALVDLAGGNPFLLREVLAASRASGVLALRDGLWQLDGDPVLSADVADAAASTLDALDPSARAAVEGLATAGPVPLHVAGPAFGTAAIEALERAGIVRASDPDDVVALHDAVLAAHLRATLGRMARRRHVTALAEAAEGSDIGPDQPDLFVRAAEWALAAAHEPDADRLLAAARLAVTLGDPARAEHLAAASASAAIEPCTEAVLLQSWCADEGGAFERSVQVLADHDPVGDEAIAAVAIRRAEQQFWVRHDAEGATALLHAAGARVEPPWDQALVAQQAIFHLLDGEVASALEAAEPLADHPTRLVGSTASLATALALVISDRPAAAAAVAEAALMALAGPDPALYIDPGVHIIAVGFAHDGGGQLVAGDELSDAVYRHALAHPGRQAQGWAALLRARVLTARGRPVAARAVALEAERIWLGANLEGLARWTATVAALAAAQAGDLPALEGCLERVDGYDPIPFRLFEPEVQRARTWAAVLRHEADQLGDVELGGAFADLAAAARAAHASGRRSLAALAAFDLVRLGAPELGTATLEDVVDDASSPATCRRRATARAAADHDGAALEHLAEQWRETGAHGLAAECLALAADARPARSTALRAEATALVGDGGLDTPALRRLGRIDASQGLTAREREIVALVAEGLSNRAIAERLVVSTRTVENHLHRAYPKLGISSRAELVGRIDA